MKYLGKPKGHAGIFFAFTFANIFMLLLGLFIVGLAIWLFVLTNSGNPFNIIFLILGIFIALLAIISFCVRTRLCSLLIYMFFLTILMLAQITLSVILVCQKEKVLQWCKDNLDSDESWEKVKEVFDTHFDVVRTLLLIICGLLVH